MNTATSSSLACIAHMNHPGFEIAEASGKTAEASWFGGVDAKYFSGARAVFTRAEEQGFIGTLAMIRSGALPPSTKIISVETSKALPGVVLGGGPVIRLGDRVSMFDHRMVFFMDRVACELQKKDRRFRCQRRVMEGGTCEATPYRLNGYVAGGIAIPLHNYHNQGKTKIGAEAVHLRDAEGAVRFLFELAMRIGEFEAATADVRSRIESGWEKYGPRLKSDRFS